MTTQTLPPTAPAVPPAPPTTERSPRPREGVALAGLLAGTAVLYLWGLASSGWANSFYAAAVQAGSESWKAFIFGSSDAASSITVDKTPLSLWPMALSVRTFGLSSWSLLVPQALEGVAAVALLHASVRRTTGSAAVQGPRRRRRDPLLHRRWPDGRRDGRPQRRWLDVERDRGLGGGEASRPRPSTG